jgi:outer membrane protein OmpA-like peptidoglycan-associated protein
MKHIFQSNILNIAIFWGIIFFSQNTFAQSARMKQALKEYDAFKYIDAVKTFEEVIQKEAENQEAKEKIAHSYRMLNDSKNAEKWYAEVVKDANTDPQNQLHYAQALAQNQKYPESKQWYQTYAKIVKSDKRGADFSNSYTDVNKFFQDAERYTVENAPFNSPDADFSPAYYQGGIVFASNRKKKERDKDNDLIHSWTGKPFLDLYYSAGGVATPKLFSKKLNSPYHEGSLHFYNNENSVIFTRNNYNAGKYEKSSDDINKLKLYYAQKVSGDWGNIQEFPFNDNEYSVGHPAISPDGTTLYFMSDMGGTLGGTDIFMCTMQGGTWSRPVNLGETINTKGNEAFPYIDANNNLYFASNGHAGLGGYDIFVSKNHSGKFSKPYNIGSPINSSKDDFGLIFDVDNNEGYFSSNRDGGKGDDDIYKFSIKSCNLIVVVVDETTGKIIKSPKLVINEKESKNEVVYVTQPDSSTFIYRTNFRTGYDLRAVKEGYNEGKKDVTEQQVLACKSYNGTLPDTIKIGLSPSTEKYDKITNNVSKILRNPILDPKDPRYDPRLDPNNPLFNPKDPRNRPFDPKNPRLTYTYKDNPNIKVVELVNVYYDLDKYYIRPDAARDLDRVLMVLNQYPEMRIAMSSHTDSRASYEYNVTLAQRRANSARQYLIDRGVSADRIEMSSFGEVKLAINCPDGVDCSEPDHQLNRRTEIAIITDINNKQK